MGIIKKQKQKKDEIFHNRKSCCRRCFPNLS